MVMMKEKVRCPWPGSDSMMIEYHDKEWGAPIHDDRQLFEKLILDIDSKFIHVRIKISESHYRVHELATAWLNRYAKNHQQPSRYFALFDTMQVSIRTRNKIKKLISEDQKQKMFR